MSKIVTVQSDPSQAAFHQIKILLFRENGLSHVVPEKELRVAVDATPIRVVAVLQQKVDDH